ncbi:MAG: endonuclease/exonuclease/phosphatase family protein [Myxococcota bacterium]|nr:endonuclease/exonuclease/phosphatase family protein [Myxococcota bacterium]
MRRAAASLLALALLAAAPASEARDPVEIAVLTYNTHGLAAWIARDDPATRFPVLVDKAGRYDVALLQEDFRHHELVQRHAHQPVVVRGNGPKPGWLGLGGAGLTTLAATRPPRARHAEPYGTCSGWLSASSDCFGNKGYLMLRLALANGAELDFWNTHLEAGDGEADTAVRSAQLERLRAAIAARSAGRAVVLGGDFNLEWHDASHRAELEAFANALGLAFGARAEHDEWDRRIDFVLFRSGDGVTLERTGGGMVHDFVLPNGTPLSDHPAVWLGLRVR